MSTLHHSTEDTFLSIFTVELIFLALLLHAENFSFLSKIWIFYPISKFLYYVSRDDVKIVFYAVFYPYG